MSLTIPTLTNEPFFTLRCRLDDEDYTLEFLYNTRADNYTLTLLDSEDKVLLAGLKVFTDVPLLGFYKYKEGLPKGELIAITLGSDKSPPRFGELGQGKRVELTYFDAVELESIAALV